MSAYPRPVMVVWHDTNAQKFNTRSYLLWGPDGVTTDAVFDSPTGSLTAVRNRVAEFAAAAPGGVVHDYTHRVFALSRGRRS